MAYQLKRKESVADGIRRIAEEQFERAAKELRSSHRPEPVHSARKRLKMLRAVLRLARPALDRAAFDRENHGLRDIGRSLSQLRDADVMVDVLRDLHPQRAADGSFRRILTRAEQDRRRIRHTMASNGAIAEARQGILAAQARVREWATDAIDRQAIVRGLRRSLERSQETSVAARRSQRDEPWHEWRKRTKDFWYHLRLVRGVWPTIMDAAIGQFKALADDLGDDHDLAIIAGRLHELAPDRSAARELHRLRQTIERRRQQLHGKARAEGDCLLVAAPKTFARQFETCWAAWK